MTQQPYYPPAQPQFPGQPAPQQYQQPYVPPQPMPQAPQYAQPQQYQQPPMQQPVPQGPPPAQGTLDDFYNQPTTGGGPGISWKDKPIGTSYAGFVSRDVGNGDVIQDTDYNTKQPKFYRDGRPVFVMKVPLAVQPSQEFPDGEVAFYVRGQARDELARAMSAAGVSGAPKQGDHVQVTLVQRKPNRQGNPSNIVQIQYTPGNSGAGTPSPAPAPAPVQQEVQPQYVPPVQMPAYDGGQQLVQPQQFQQAPVQQPAVPSQPIQQQIPAAMQNQMVQPQAPAGQQQGGLPVPADFNQEQAALLAKITGQQQAG